MNKQLNWLLAGKRLAQFIYGAALAIGTMIALDESRWHEALLVVWIVPTVIYFGGKWIVSGLLTPNKGE